MNTIKVTQQYNVGTKSFLNEEDALLYKQINDKQELMLTLAKEIKQLKKSCKHPTLKYVNTYYEPNYGKEYEDEFGNTKYEGAYMNNTVCECCGASVTQLKDTGEIIGTWF